MDSKIETVATEKDAGVRLDVFLSRHLPSSRSFAVRLIEQGSVMVEGRPRRPAFKLKYGMRVHGAYRTATDESTLEAHDLPLSILYEDPWIIVIDKPAGLVVHPGAGTVEETLVNALVARYPDIRAVGDPLRPGIVHRLDKLTSGVMVVARSTEAYAALANAFKAHEHQREYLAVCYGHMPKEQGTIDAFIQRNPSDRKRMTSRIGEGRKAVTHWRVVKEWEAFSLLRLSLETGRTHQIRVHLSDMGHPVAGDAQYGGRKRAGSIADLIIRSAVMALERQMLHAARLAIIHPINGKHMEFTCDMPEDMKGLIELLDEMAV